MMIAFFLVLLMAMSIQSFLVPIPPRRPRAAAAAASALSLNMAEDAAAAVPEKPSCFERAVECAEHYGRCDVDELLNLADELEAVQGSFYEAEGEKIKRAKEEMDRLDVARTLKLEAELQLSQHYLNERNLFAKDVHEEHDMHEREELLDAMQKFGTD